MKREKDCVYGMKQKSEKWEEFRVVSGCILL